MNNSYQHYNTSLLKKLTKDYKKYLALTIAGIVAIVGGAFGGVYFKDFAKVLSYIFTASSVVFTAVNAKQVISKYKHIKHCKKNSNEQPIKELEKYSNTLKDIKEVELTKQQVNSKVKSNIEQNLEQSEPEI